MGLSSVEAADDRPCKVLAKGNEPAIVGRVGAIAAIVEVERSPFSIHTHRRPIFPIIFGTATNL